MTDHRAELSVPEVAPYGLFGVSSRGDLKRALAALALLAKCPEASPPDICILDLGSPGLRRLGPNWEETVEIFIAEVHKRFPNMPFVAVTQDPFVARRITSLLREVLKTKDVGSKVLVRVSRDALSPDPAITTVSETTPNFSTVAGPTADAIEALSEAARGCSDPSLAGTLRREMGSLRKAASLPCGLAPTYDFLCREIGQSSAERFLEYRSRGTLLAPIDDALRSEIGGAERTRLEKARHAVAAAFDALDGETPIGSLLSDLAAAISRKSSRAIVAFASKTDLLLGENRLVNDGHVGHVIRRRMENDHLRMISAEDLDSELSEIENSKDRNTWKRLVLIAPSMDWLSSVVSRAWLPDELIIVCERTLASRVADTYHRLSSHPDLSGAGHLGERLAGIAKSAKAEVEARGVKSVDLDLDSRTEVRVDETMIDLTDEDAEEGTEIVEMTLASGRTLRTRAGSTIIRYDQSAEFNPFERADASEIRVRDLIVVPDNAFLEEARELLPIRVLAQNWVEVYHSTVEAHLPNVHGATLNAKARKILTAIQAQGARTQTQAAVIGWLRVEEYKKLPPEQRQPHAPQRRREFNAFMSALGVNQALADKMWMEGIQPLRIDRRRAGQRMAQAFVSVLVDPHGTASGFDASVREGIQVLRQKAVEHLDEVVAVDRFDIGERHE
jgi:hypothetical protein